MRDMAKFADLCHGCEVRGKEVVSQYDAGNVPASALRCISALEKGQSRWQPDDIWVALRARPPRQLCLLHGGA